MWYIIFFAIIACVIGSLIYISFRTARFGFVKRICGGRKGFSRLLGLVGCFIAIAILWVVWDIMNALVCIIHLTVIWMLCDLVTYIISKIRRKKATSYRAGYIAMALCIIYIGIGYLVAHDVKATYYTLETEKLSEDIRLIQISDAHIGATLHADDFTRYVLEMNELHPDVVVIIGDFVDDDTTKEDLIGACEALGNLVTKYGVFFAYGNHDKGYYREEERGWSSALLLEELLKNGIIVLEDEAQLIDDRFYMIGRQDRSEAQRGGSRMSAEQVLDGLDHSKYMIVLDHQPSDFEAEAAAGADLVLCGHTHGGQFIPIRYVGEWTGEICLRYGHEKRKGTDFIVSSGISNWAFKFRTGCISEYVVIDIKGIN